MAFILGQLNISPLLHFACLWNGAVYRPLTSESFRQSDIQQYRISLAKAARRFKRYPALAKERGWEGVVEIELRTSSLLQSPEIDLLRTSGYLLLDTQALEMVTRAVRVTPIPEGLSGSDFSILLPIRFSLEGQ